MLKSGGVWLSWTVVDDEASGHSAASGKDSRMTTCIYLSLAHIQRYIINVHVRVIWVAVRVFVVQELDANGLARIG